MPQYQPSQDLLYEFSVTMLLHLNSSEVNIIHLIHINDCRKHKSFVLELLKYRINSTHVCFVIANLSPDQKESRFSLITTEPIEWNLYRATILGTASDQSNSFCLDPLFVQGNPLNRYKYLITKPITKTSYEICSKFSTHNFNYGLRL